MARRKLGSALLPLALFSAPHVAGAEDKSEASEQAPDDGSETKEASSGTPGDAEGSAQKKENAATVSPETTGDSAPPSSSPGKDSDKKDRGFYLRSTLGGGHAWAAASATPDQPDVTMQLLGGNLMLNPGYQLNRQFAVHADLYGALLFAHKTQSDAETDDYAPQGLGMVASTVGVGATYQSTPTDLFISGGIGVSQAWGNRFVYAGEVGRSAVITETKITNPGYAAHGSVGKLFALHPRWALGASFNYNFQTLGALGENSLTFERVHSVWLGFSTVFQPGEYVRPSRDP